MNNLNIVLNYDKELKLINDIVALADIKEPIEITETINNIANTISNLKKENNIIKNNLISNSYKEQKYYLLLTYYEYFRNQKNDLNINLVKDQITKTRINILIKKIHELNNTQDAKELIAIYNTCSNDIISIIENPEKMVHNHIKLFIISIYKVLERIKDLKDNFNLDPKTLYHLLTANYIQICTNNAKEKVIQRLDLKLNPY